MGYANPQTLSIDNHRKLKIVLINDLNPKKSTFYVDVSEEEETNKEYHLSDAAEEIWTSEDEVQQWRDDYYAAIRL
jgi:hypothetical protein